MASGKRHCDREVARVSIVNSMCQVIYSSFVKPSVPIVSYLTPYLGFYFEPLGQTGISFEMYGIIAAFFLLLYNGRRGYHAKWWVYFEWSFFPVHILLLAGIFALISL